MSYLDGTWDFTPYHGGTAVNAVEVVHKPLFGSQRASAKPKGWWPFKVLRPQTVAQASVND